MILKVELGSFYSRGDERRLFEGFKEIAAIRDVKGVGRELMLEIELAALSKEALRELLALLWRYEIPLAPLRAFAEKKKFSWLNDARGYWHSDMFAEHSVSAPGKRQALSIDA
ncbi:MULTISPECIES: hypothetical protein [unclassified Rhizobacter]|uniref:hypothetical protein n=1 Tax=unclassified Rhizobacter TaxID=2640088 RepID=UPI0006F8B604|nr:MULTISPECIES: hypothetical protein [unclassified Rhizobacter]KQU74581.1 hypothetical protein ASC88_26910 [Rhizobacter sp. Root29]KQW13463.1 hypothetical protein ASC98_18155 [Rhizobacter sp. Root1238]KRB23096.1 hypothetical protein ASE08_20620 [Rhizobacter sp. Root16D2]